MDSLGMLRRTTSDATTMVQSVRSDDLTRPTPCSEWNVSALVAHMADVCKQFTVTLTRGEWAPPPATADGSDRDVVAAYADASRQLLEAWSAPGALERTVKMPSGDAPGAFAIQFIIADQLLHTWDLARAIGRSYRMDTEAAEATLRMMQQMMRPEYRGPGKGFGEVVPCADEAPLQDRLVAFSGRTP